MFKEVRIYKVTFTGKSKRTGYASSGQTVNVLENDIFGAATLALSYLKEGYDGIVIDKIDTLNMTVIAGMENLS